MGFWSYVAQIVNFLVFVLILYYLLYKPVGRIMKERKDEMETEGREAEKKRAEAEEMRAEAERLTAEIENKRDSVLKEAREQAESQRKELLQKAEEQGRDKLERFRRIMEEERAQLLEKVTGELRETVQQVAGSVLADASVSLAERGIERVGALLEEMDKKDLDGAVKALKKSSGRVGVRSAGALDKKQKDKLIKMFSEKFGSGSVELDVEEDPSLLAGLEVTVGHINLEAHWRGMIDDALEERHGAGSA